jgi:hypothetical protein
MRTRSLLKDTKQVAMTQLQLSMLWALSRALTITST